MNNSSADDRTFSQKFHRFAQSVILSFFLINKYFCCLVSFESLGK